MKSTVTFWLVFVTFLSVSCSESQNENEDSTESSDSSEIANEETDATTDSDTTPADPNAWHEDCPIEQFEYRMMDVGEVKLNVACRGSGPTVVFLHGFPEFHYSWKPVMDELATEYRLVAPDQRGYNISDKPEEIEAYELPRLTQDIVNLLPLMSADPVILVGHDWGGPVGWAVAHTEGAHLRGYLAANGPHPLRFSYLIEFDEAQRTASSYMNFFRSPGSENTLTADYWAGAFSDFLSAEDLEIYREAWSQPGAMTGGLNWYRANSLDFAETQAAMANMLPKVIVPTTVMWGLDDTFVLPSNAEGLGDYVEDLLVETFPGVDHWIEHRIPEEVARGVRELDARSQAVSP